MTGSSPKSRGEPPRARHGSERCRSSLGPGPLANTLRLCATGCALVLAATDIDAEELVTEDHLLGDIPVVLSVTRLEQPRSRAPAAVTIIDRQMIDASGARTLPDLLRMVPGFYVGFRRGHMPMVTYHGLSGVFSRRLQVLVDGRPVYIPSYGGVPWFDLPLDIDEIKRIEVIRGPNTAAYGANAFLATISIETYHASESQGHHVRVLSGTRQERQYSYRYGAKSGDLNYRVTAAYDLDDEFDHMNDRRRTALTRLRADYRLAPNETVLLQAGVNHGSRGQGFERSPENQRDRQAESHFVQLRWKRKLGVDEDLSVQFFTMVHEWDEEVTQDFLGGPTYFNFDVRSKRTDFELQHRFKPTPESRLVWGLQARHDEVYGGNYVGLIEGGTFQLARLFGNLEWYWTPQLSGNFGLMAEHNSYTGTGLSPRLAVNYTVTPGHTLRYTFSQATRLPVALEERSDGVVHVPHLGTSIPTLAGNRELEPERIISREIGYFGELKDFPLTIDAKVYHDSVTGLISLDESALPRTFENTDMVTITGTEVQLDYRPSEKGRIYTGYAITNISGPNHSDNYTTSAPHWTFNLMAIRQLPRHWTSSMAYYYTSAVFPLDGDLIDPVDRLDLKLSKEMQFGRSTAELSFVAQSALGDYIEYQNDNTFERRYYVMLKVDF